MSILRRLFRPSDVEIWRRLETEVGARFLKGGSWNRDKIEVTHDDWTITLDTYFSAASKAEYTRLRTECANPERLRLTVYRRGFFSDAGKVLGMQDIEIGHPEFDRDFIIKGNSEAKLRALLADATIRELIAAQPEVRFTLDDADGELAFEVPGVIRDIPRLKQLFDLFAATLDHLSGQAASPSGGP